MAVDVGGPGDLRPDERPAVAALYRAAFARKLRVLLGRPAERLVAAALEPSRLLLARDGDDVVGLAGLAHDGISFLDPSAGAWRRAYPVTAALRRRLWGRTHTRPRPDQVMLEALAVRADRRSTGTGTLLLDAVETRARELGKAAVVLEVVDTNPRAAALYARRGYRTVRTAGSALFRPAGFTSADLMLKPV